MQRKMLAGRGWQGATVGAKVLIVTYFFLESLTLDQRQLVEKAVPI